jgi:hypothetical protein
MSLDIKKSCSFQILISLTTVVRPGYCHLKVKLQPSTDVDVVMLCFGLMPHPPPIYQSRSQ